MTAQAGGASPVATALTDRVQLRRELRHTRRAIPVDTRRKAALAVATHLQRHWLLKPRLRVGIYLAMRDELSLTPFIKLAWSRHCQLFAPHIAQTRRRRMSFHHFTVNTRLRNHRWGMMQLVDISGGAISSATLDVALLPLLGFDAQGNRLGMGGGFYDRYFARLARGRRWRRPLLIGVAFACQQIPALLVQPHDVRLDGVVTERGWMRFHPAKPA